MKKQIHPKYEKTIVECACGNSFETRSTAAGTIKVELCSACHPFFTGKQKFVDTAGRVDKFRARMEAAAKREATKGGKTNEKQAQATNKEKLAQIKENLAKGTETEAAEIVETELEAPVIPGEVTQESTSDVELAAADELADESGEHKPREEKKENQ